MYKSTQLGEIMETTCHHCQSRFRISESQLKKAIGKVRCGECDNVFDALVTLKSYDGKLPINYKPEREEIVQPQIASKFVTEKLPQEQLSLHEAMYGDDRSSFAHFSPLLWLIGILMLLSVGITQILYYQRYELIDKPRFQQQILNLCQFLPCGEADFSSKRQIKLLERNVFTHPVTSNALMVTGSFVNQASFPQKLPDMLVSLSDIKGDLIANRIFKPSEYLQTDSTRKSLPSAVPVQFRLELVDPGTDALTYEFEFY